MKLSYTYIVNWRKLCTEFVPGPRPVTLVSYYYHLPFKRLPQKMVLTHSNNLLAIFWRIVWVCLTIFFWGGGFSRKELTWQWLCEDDEDEMLLWFRAFNLLITGTSGSKTHDNQNPVCDRHLGQQHYLWPNTWWNLEIENWDWSIDCVQNLS